MTGTPRWLAMQQFEPTNDFLTAVSDTKGHPLVDECWRNEEYEAYARYIETESGFRGRAGSLHLSIKRLDREPIHDWRDLQAIKNDIAGPEREAIELYPAESRLVDQANQFHLWVMPEGAKLQIGFSERIVMDEEDARKNMEDILQGAQIPGADRGRQRDWRPGISTGPAYGGSQ